MDVVEVLKITRHSRPLTCVEVVQLPPSQKIAAFGMNIASATAAGCCVVVGGAHQVHEGLSGNRTAVGTYILQMEPAQRGRWRGDEPNRTAIGTSTLLRALHA